MRFRAWAVLRRLPVDEMRPPWRGRIEVVVGSADQQFRLAGQLVIGSLSRWDEGELGEVDCVEACSVDRFEGLESYRSDTR